MYKNAARFSQRATRSPTSWDHALAAEKGRGLANATKRMSRREVRVLQYLRSEAGQRFLAFLEKLVICRDGYIAQNYIKSVLDEEKILDPTGAPWSKKATKLLCDALVKRRRISRS